MTEYRVEYTDCRGKTTVRPWVECDEKTARRATREAILSIESAFPEFKPKQ